MHGQRIERPVLEPGQEWVWDFPRPPRVEEVEARLRVEFAGRTIADSVRGVRVLETSHPPTYYIPLNDVEDGVLIPGPGTSWCEFKGRARYYEVAVGDHRAPRAAWGYDNPDRGFERLAGMAAFYPSRMSGCFVDGERVKAQEGDFYGGWITSRVVGPFKGGPTTLGW